MATEKVRVNNEWVDVRDNGIGAIQSTSQASEQNLASNTWTSVCSLNLNKGSYVCVGRVNGYGHGQTTPDRMEIGIGSGTGGEQYQRNSTRLATESIYRINCTTTTILTVANDNTAVKLWASVQQGGKVADGRLYAMKIK